MDLHVKYRPSELKMVAGQAPVVGSLEVLLDEEEPPHSYLFHGPSGVGKTTLARIVAAELDVPKGGVYEIDAATNSGAEAMRTLLSAYGNYSMGGNRAIIIDEAHGLSRQAWDSMLKLVEEPPSHLFFLFCTTAISKVPKTIITRCHSFELVPLDDDSLAGVIEHVMAQEGFDVHKKVFDAIVRESQGSARQALVYLSSCAGLPVQEALRLVHSIEEGDPDAMSIARALISNDTKDSKWGTVRRVLEILEKNGTQAESIRIVIVRYLAACIRGSKKADRALWFARRLECFSSPYEQQDGYAPLMLSLLECITIGE